MTSNYIFVSTISQKISAYASRQMNPDEFQ